MAGSQIVKWGNSLAIRIPKPLAEEAGLGEGDRVLMEAADGQIAVRRADEIPTLQELVAQITPENRYDETSTGRERAKEGVKW
ncbi:MAG: AbrB/MazE/SpoVT family DNA-binding domain-containing protein [Terriglobales bacterium]|jgi:antitoxin MazE